MRVPSKVSRYKIKAFLALVCGLLLFSSKWWNRFVWVSVGAGAVAFAWMIASWNMAIRRKVRESQGVDLFQDAPEAGVQPQLLAREVLQRDFVRTARQVATKDKKPKICFIRGNAGGGHVAALTAIKEVLVSTGCDWEFSEVDMPSVLERDHRNPTYWLFGVTGEELYNWCLEAGTPVSAFCARALSAISNVFMFLLHTIWSDGRKLCRDVWLRESPDVIISVIPTLNLISWQGLELAHMTKVPYLCIVTDFTDTFYHPWLQCNKQWVIAGTEEIGQRALEKGYPAERVLTTSGMVIKPSFYATSESVSREAGLRSLGLNAELRTVLVFYGGYAPTTKYLQIARQLGKLSQRVNGVFLCGKNDTLVEQLNALPKDYPRFVVGFTEDVARIMRLSDLVICKPGPGVVTEASCFGLPMLVELNMATLAQEESVADWVVKARVGHLWRREGELRELVDYTLECMGPCSSSHGRRVGHRLKPNT